MVAARLPRRAFTAAAVVLGSALVACSPDESGIVGTTIASGGSGAGLPLGGAGGANVGGGANGGSQSGGSGDSGGAGGESADAGIDAEPFVPEPIPVIDEEPPAMCADPLPDGDFQFLDDTCGAKRYPTFQDRDLVCPTVDPSATVALTGGGTVTYLPSSATIEVDSTALAGLVPDDLHVTVILIRRVGGVPHYRYLSNGTHDIAFQPWSTTKVLAAANAAARLRIASGYEVGLTASVDGTPLGDLVTSICNYDYDPYSSNSLGAYFHNIGGRQRAYDLIHALWLDRPLDESFGGNYGQAAPALGYTFEELGGSSVSIAADTATGFSNHLSARTLAEAVKRLALHREEPSERLPGIQWDDVATLFYGAEGSQKYGPWGGMCADKAIYLQSSHDLDYLERRSRGRWTIFSKCGLGTSGQFANIGYACFPVLDDALEPVPGWGREVVIAAELALSGSSWVARDRLLARAYRQIMIRVLDGRL